MRSSGYSPNFFNGALPNDLFLHILQWINVQGPVVKLIVGKPNPEQKSAVTAVAIGEQGKPDFQKPDLNTYHLIRGDDPNEPGKIVYSIGFCKRLNDGSLAHVIGFLDEKSPLLRYVREDLQHLEYSKLFPYDPGTQTYQQNSRDRLLLKYVTLEIKAARGLTQHPLRNRTRLSVVCKEARAWMNGCAIKTEQQAFKKSVRQVMLEDLLHHIAYGEEKEAMEIVKADLSLILFPNMASVTSCSPEIEYLQVPAFHFAVLTDWLIAKKMVEAVIESEVLSDDQKLEYTNNLLSQLEYAQAGETQIRFNNLLNKGVQILDGNILEHNEEERARYRADVVKRNSYHLIITTEDRDGELMVVSCVLGYRNPKTREYNAYDIPTNHGLFTISLELYESLKTANDGYGDNIQYEHFFTRSNRDLALVNSILKKLDIETQWIEFTSGPKFDALLGCLDFRIENMDNGYWLEGRSLEQWHGEICAELRLFPALLWQFYTSNIGSWTPDWKVIKYLNDRDHLPFKENYYNEEVLPVSLSLGNKFNGLPGKRAPWSLYYDSSDSGFEKCFVRFIDIYY